MTDLQLEVRRGQAVRMFSQAGIEITKREREEIEIADFGLSEFEKQGLGILVYVNTDRCCAKELALWPSQTCPEHRHPPVGSDPGKEETFRCRWGMVFLYVAGTPTLRPRCEAPAGSNVYTVWHEIELQPGDQYTIMPNTLHWFQAGPNGAVVSEFSTKSTDESDVFTDKSIRRTSSSQSLTIHTKL